MFGSVTAGPVFGPTLLGFTRHGRAIAATLQPGQHGDVVFLEFGLDSPGTPPREFSVRIPTEATVEEFALSPQGDRMAWLFHVEHVSSFFHLLHLLLPFTKAPAPRATVELWLSQLDGSNMRKIGHQDITPGNDWGLPADIHWLPGGKRLSFTYQQTLYTVPAD